MDLSIETELLTKARNGDRVAFTRLVEEYRHLALALAFQMTGSAADMDDIAQETFMRAFQNLKSFRGEASFKTWLGKITMNLSSNYRRSRKASRTTDITEERALAAQTEGQDQRMIQHEQQMQIRKAVAELPSHYRSVVMLRDFQDLSYKEITDTLGIPIGTVMSRLAKARELLRDCLTPYFGRSNQ
jgi:RNA polymerase sigma-70 factor (ECF subfamily)